MVKSIEGIGAVSTPRAENVKIQAEKVPDKVAGNEVRQATAPQRANTAARVSAVYPDAPAPAKPKVADEPAASRVAAQKAAIAKAKADRGQVGAATNHIVVNQAASRSERKSPPEAGKGGQVDIEA